MSQPSRKRMSQGTKIKLLEKQNGDILNTIQRMSNRMDRSEHIGMSTALTLQAMQDLIIEKTDVTDDELNTFLESRFKLFKAEQDKQIEERKKAIEDKLKEQAAGGGNVDFASVMTATEDELSAQTVAETTNNETEDSNVEPDNSDSESEKE